MKKSRAIEQEPGGVTSPREAGGEPAQGSPAAWRRGGKGLRSKALRRGVRQLARLEEETKRLISELASRGEAGLSQLFGAAEGQERGRDSLLARSRELGARAEASGTLVVERLQALPKLAFARLGLVTGEELRGLVEQLRSLEDRVELLRRSERPKHRGDRQEPSFGQLNGLRPPL